jgi:prepilin-type N-terminal cleavage/methylation domain-containing protein
MSPRVLVTLIFPKLVLQPVNNEMSRKLPLKSRSGYTLIELLAVMFIVAVTGIVEESVTRRFGRWSGIGAGALTLRRRSRNRVSGNPWEL